MKTWYVVQKPEVAPSAGHWTTNPEDVMYLTVPCHSLDAGLEGTFKKFQKR